MASTQSTMLKLNTIAPEFCLPNPVSGGTVRRTSYNGKPLLIAFICNHCPYVIHILASFSQFADNYKNRGLETVAINSNDTANYPEDSPEKMINLIKKYQISFPYLFDETQSVAKSYYAACTPDFFLFNQNSELFYRGQFDEARPRNDIPVTGVSLINAVDALLAGDDEYHGQQTASMGCNIKWKPGNEPDYF